MVKLKRLILIVIILINNHKNNGEIILGGEIWNIDYLFIWGYFWYGGVAVLVFEWGGVWASF